MKINYTQITRTRPWRRFTVIKHDNWGFGVVVWRRGCTVRLFGHALKFETRDPWDHPEDLDGGQFRLGLKRRWRRREAA